MLGELLSLGLVVAWTLQHSLLATNWVKNKVVTDPFDQRYRIGYNIVSILTLLGLEVVIARFLEQQGSSLTPFLNQSSNRVQYLFYILLGIGGGMAVGAFIQTNPIVFAGLRREQSNNLQVNRVYRFSRHPMHAGGILVLLAFLVTTTNSVVFTRLIGYISYLIIGGRFQENRLRAMLLGYEKMLTRGYLFPYRFSHFQILFGKGK